MTIAFWVLALIASAIIGSFLNVVIYRGPALWGLIDVENPRGNLASPRSYCPHCRTPLASYHLIPIVSFLILRGRCSACSAKISPRYPLVETVAVLIAAAAITIFGFTPAALLGASFGCVLLTLGSIDWETGYLPDWLTLPLMLAGLIVNGFGLFTTPLSALIGAGAGVFVFWAIGEIWRQFRRVDALGLGDAKLMGALGAWCGWSALPIIVLAGSLVTLAGVIAMRGSGERVSATDTVPFGPGLCAAGFAVFIVMSWPK